MALNSLGLGLVFTASDLASNAIQNLKKNFTGLAERVGVDSGRIDKAFGAMSAGAAVFAAGLGAVGTGFALATVAGKFQQGVAAVGAVAGASSEELEALKNAALDAGMATQFSPTEAAAGLRELSAAGFNATEAIALLQPALDLAAGSLGELSPEAAAGLASQAIKAFGLDASKADVHVDKMLNSLNLFALSAGDLPLALGTASRGAQALNASFDETLIALGLVKNVVPGVERASTAVAVSMERMANPQVQQKLRGIGVEVADSQGKFRSFFDIIQQMGPALDRMTEQERAAFLQQTFGQEALGGLNAIFTQLTNGIKNESGEILKGGAAIEYLRQSFANSEGTARSFAQQMTDTFEGQKGILAGVVQTLGIVSGEAFATVLKPVVTLVADAVTFLVKIIRATPEPVKKAFAAFVVGAGAIVALVGAVVAAKAAFALLGVALKAIGLSLGGLALTFLPAILAVGALGLAIAGFVIAFRRNIGGIGDFVRSVGERIKLAFQGIAQLLGEGQISGPLAEDLMKAENTGLRNFLANVGDWIARVKRFIDDFTESFSRGIDAARPAIDELLGAIRRLGQAFGFLGERNDTSEAASSLETFGRVGAAVGQALATAFEFIVQGLTFVVESVTRFGEGIGETWGLVRESIDFLGRAFGNLTSAIGDAISSFASGNDAASQSGGFFRALGNVIGVVVVGIIDILGILINVIAGLVPVVAAVIHGVVGIFSGLITILTGIVDIIRGIFTGDWARVWDGMKQVAIGVVKAIVSAVVGLVEAIGGAVDSIMGFFGKKTEIRASIADFREDVMAGLSGTLSAEPAAVTPASTPAGVVPAVGPVMSSAMPAVAATRATLSSMPEPASTPPQPINMSVALNVDGEVLASKMISTTTENASRAFSPVPVMG